MNIHEYQAKALLRDFGVAVPAGQVAYTPNEAAKAAEALGGDVLVVKSQIHAGGRGAGHFAEQPDGKGGVRVVKLGANGSAQIADTAAAMLGNTLVTKDRWPGRSPAPLHRKWPLPVSLSGAAY